jgi:D5-like protein
MGGDDSHPPNSDGAGPAAAGRPDDTPNLTDRGNAVRLIRRHGVGLRHCHPWKKWITWDGHRWRIDDRARVTTLFKETISSLFRWAQARVEQISKELEVKTDEPE